MSVKVRADWRSRAASQTPTSRLNELLGHHHLEIAFGVASGGPRRGDPSHIAVNVLDRVRAGTRPSLAFTNEVSPKVPIGVRGLVRQR